jgi:hypothetical protein
VEHRLGERHGLRVIEPTEEDRHQERRHLIVGDFSLAEIREQPRDLGLREGLTITLRCNELDDRAQHLHAA